MSLVALLQRTRFALDLRLNDGIRFMREWFNFSGHSNRQHLAGQMFVEWYQDLNKFIMAHTASQKNIQRSSMAIIVIVHNENRYYLMQWNDNWKMFNLIGGKMDNAKGDNGSFLRTMERELEEELGLNCPGDCSVVQEISQLKMEQFSRREQRTKNYLFSVFEVSIAPMFIHNNGKPNFAARWLSTGRENVFVSGAEINDLCTKDGRPISLTTRHILQEIDELPRN